MIKPSTFVPFSKTYNSMNAEQQRHPNQNPSNKLSVKLLNTYKHINLIYYSRRKKEQQEHNTSKRYKRNLPNKKECLPSLSNHNSEVKTPACSTMNSEFDYKITPGVTEVFNQRYESTGQLLGKGSFGQVVKAVDIHTGEQVAIKIIKCKKSFATQAKTEIALLHHLNSRHQPSDCIVKLLDVFLHRGHQCLVFELLSYNLFEVLQSMSFTGISLNLLRKFTRQILEALEVLSRPDVNIIHCDLKPENILLSRKGHSNIKVIDFGSSCQSNRKMYQYIQSRYYRSPEVLLGLKYSVAIDMWSLGCIMVEMHTGEPLFGGENQLDQMRKIVKVLGMPPLEMLEASPKKHFDSYFEKHVRTSSDGSIVEYNLKSDHHCAQIPEKLRQGSSSLAEIIGSNTGGPGGRRLGKVGHMKYDYDIFLDLLTKILTINPDKRITPADALLHPFITGSYSGGSRKQPSSSSRRNSSSSIINLEIPNAVDAGQSQFCSANTSGRIVPKMYTKGRQRIYTTSDNGCVDIDPSDIHPAKHRRL